MTCQTHLYGTRSEVQLHGWGRLREMRRLESLMRGGRDKEYPQRHTRQVIHPRPPRPHFDPLHALLADLIHSIRRRPLQPITHSTHIEQVTLNLQHVSSPHMHRRAEKTPLAMHTWTDMDADVRTRSRSLQLKDRARAGRRRETASDPRVRLPKLYKLHSAQQQHHIMQQQGHEQCHQPRPVASTSGRHQGREICPLRMHPKRITRARASASLCGAQAFRGR
jgi:hypothetical protein